VTTAPAATTASSPTVTPGILVNIRKIIKAGQRGEELF
jgi:hypothetical protein